jgi:hypothetical protein
MFSFVNLNGGPRRIMFFSVTEPFAVISRISATAHQCPLAAGKARSPQHDGRDYSQLVSRGSVQLRGGDAGRVDHAHYPGNAPRGCVQLQEKTIHVDPGEPERELIVTYPVCTGAPASGPGGSLPRR